MIRFIKIFLVAGVLFGVFMGLVFGIISGLQEGLLSGAISGALFGLFISILLAVQEKKFKTLSREITNGKTIVKEGSANYLKKSERVGGWLVLTSDEIKFMSHSFNVQNSPVEIKLNQIAQVKPVFSLGFIPKGLQIILKDDSIEKFVVNNQKGWIEAIKKAI